MDNKTLFYFGHPKAGSTWFGGLMAGISIDLGLNFFYGQYTLPSNQEILKFKRYDMIISQNSDYQSLINLNIPYKGFHIIRDPRDLCVSSYFSFKKTHVLGDWRQLKDLRDKLNAVSMEEGMLEIFNFNKGFFNSIHTWNYGDENILELKYEDIINNPEEYLLRICDFLFCCDPHTSIKFNVISIYNRILLRNRRFFYDHLKIKSQKLPVNHIKNLNKKLSFKELSKGRNRGQENFNSHYRKGISGDWKHYITGNLKEMFKTQYGNLLIQLGYERDNSW